MAKWDQALDAVTAPRWSPWLPAWMRGYRPHQFGGDISAGFVVAIMLMPQSLAYAMLAGVPPQMGIFASILPLIAYAVLGSSMTLAVGPVAVCSLLTATTLQPIAAAGSSAYLQGAGLLAAMSGLFLLLCGLCRLGFLAQLLSAPVNNGFTTGTGILILLSQIPPLIGLPGSGGSAWNQLVSLQGQLADINIATATLGGATLALLLIAKYWLPGALRYLGVAATTSLITTRLAPLLMLIFATAVVDALRLHEKFGIRVVGSLPMELPSLTVLHWSSELIVQLLVPSMILALTGFIGSLSMAQALANARHERIDVNAELRAVGAANIASAFSGGCAVSGGFARSAVNVAAGAQTPLAGVVTALLMALVAVGMGSAMASLPQAALAAMIVVALASLVDVADIKRTWRFDRADAVAQLATAAGVLIFGIAEGIALGVAISLATLIWRSSTPHIVELHAASAETAATTHSSAQATGMRFLRIDENVQFSNALGMEQKLRREISRIPGTAHIILVMSRVSHIDCTGLAMLRNINRTLDDQRIKLHFSDLDDILRVRLQQTLLYEELTGNLFATMQDAFNSLPQRVATK